MPWTTRQKTSDSSEWDWPQKNDAAVKSTIEPM